MWAVFGCEYDPNGNMTQRVEMSGSQRITYTQEWDIENKLVAVTNTVTGQVTRFYRDADGNLVKKSDGAGTLMIVNAIFEHITTTNESTSYYVFGSQRPSAGSGTVAMRVAGAVYWLHGDHLGSASLTTNIAGTKVAEMCYLPFGETRWMSGTTPTDRRYTGQRELAGVGLYDYNARMYWPAAGRFVSADTVVPGPGNPQNLNRYAYTLNNPLRYNDPTGHDVGCSGQDAGQCNDSPDWIDQYCLGDYYCEGAYLSAFLKAHPDYNPLTDPARLDSEGNLKYFYQYRVYAETQEFRRGRGDYRIDEQLFEARFSGEYAVAAATDGAQTIGALLPASVGAVGAAVTRLRNPFGQPGKPDHIKTVAHLRHMAQSEYAHDATVSIRESVSIFRATGGQVNRKPDVSVWRGDQLLKVYEAARVDQSGAFVPREQVKMLEYWENGIPHHFERVR